MTERGRVRFGRRQLDYGVERSARRQTVSIIVTGEGITVKAPEGVSADQLARLVSDRGAWVVGKQARFAALLEHTPKVNILRNGSAVRYLGRQCRLWRVPQLSAPRLRGRRLEVPDLEPKALREALERWYRAQAARVITQRVQLYARRLGRFPNAVLIRGQRTRWGSCSARGDLRFNWRVIMAPMSVLDYVVAHELCHLEHLHHGPQFWKRLGHLLPDHAERRERLAQEGPTYTI